MGPAAVALAFLALCAAPAAAAIRGRVVSPDGTPVPRALVRAYAPETFEQAAVRRLAGTPRTPLGSTRADRDGAFRLEVDRPLVTVEARADGFAPAFAAVARGDPPLTLRANPARLLRPYVIGARPVEGAVVVWTASDSTGASAEVIAHTNAAGSYEVPDPRAWAQDGVVLHPDFAPLDVPTAISELHPQRLVSGEAVEGKVVDSEGRPLAGATVWVGGRRHWPAARTHADGAFRIAHAPSRWRTLSARIGSLVGSLQRPWGPITIVAVPARSLSGRVADEHGRPVSTARVFVFSDTPWHDSDLTDPQGRYRIEGLVPGRYVAQAIRTGFAREGLRAHGEYTSDLTTDLTATRDLTLRRLITVRGRVVDERGGPIAGALVAFGYEEPTVYMPEAYRSDHGPVWTGRDGRFTVTAAPPPKDVNDERLARRPLVVLKHGFVAGRAGHDVLRAAGGRPVTVRLERGVELAGHVTTEQGAPIPGVRVTLVEEGTAFGTLMPSHTNIARAESAGWVVSDEAGRFSVRVRPVVHHLRLQKPGHAPRLVEAHDPRAGRVLDVVLPPGGRVAGRVTRPGGEGVPGVDVVLTRPPDISDVARAATRADGGFEFDDLAPGGYLVRVHDNERGFSRSERVTVPGPAVEVEFGAAGLIRGRVLDAESGKPVTAFWTAIEWKGDEQTEEGNREKDVEDADGRFTWVEVPAGETAVTVAAEGYVSRTVPAVKVVADAPPLPLEIALERAVPVRGRVTSDGKTGVPRATVVAQTPAGERVSAAYTDAQGAYELRGVRPGELSLTVYAEGFLRASVAVDARAPAVADVTLDRGLSLEGVVLREGAPLEGATVSLHLPQRHGPPVQAQTDAQGRFRLSGLAAGRHRLGAAPPRRGPRATVDVEVPARWPVRLTLPPLQVATLRGRLVGLGPGDAQAVVINSRNADGDGASGRVHADLAFVIEDAPVGRVTLSAYANTGEGTRVARSQDLHLAPGQSTDVTLTFTDDVVSGTVTRRGEPVADAYVSFNSERTHHASGRTSAAGRYRVLGLEPGRYTVQVSSGADVLLTEERTVASPGTLNLELGNVPAAPP